jgi:hypothetical protein
MAGFDRKNKEEFGVRNAKSGEWYQYGQYGQADELGRFLRIDEMHAYFDETIADVHRPDGMECIIRKGEIAVNLQSITDFFPSNHEETKLLIAYRNWHRQYLDEFVAIQTPQMEPMVGKVVKAYRSAFHLKPHVSGISTRQLIDNKEKIIIFNTPVTIETITKEQLDKFIGHI